MYTHTHTHTHTPYRKMRRSSLQRIHLFLMIAFQFPGCAGMECCPVVSTECCLSPSGSAFSILVNSLFTGKCTCLPGSNVKKTYLRWKGSGNYVHIDMMPCKVELCQHLQDTCKYMYSSNGTLFFPHDWFVNNVHVSFCFAPELGVLEARDTQ